MFTLHSRAVGGKKDEFIRKYNHIIEILKSQADINKPTKRKLHVHVQVWKQMYQCFRMTLDLAISHEN